MRKAEAAAADLRPEYKRSDFGKLERGKYVTRLKKGTNVVIVDPRLAQVFPGSLQDPGDGALVLAMAP